MGELVLGLLGTKQETLAMPVLCSVIEQTGKTDFHRIISQQYNNSYWDGISLHTVYSRACHLWNHKHETYKLQHYVRN